MRGNLAPSVYMVFIIQLRFRLYALKSSYFSGEGGNQLFPFLRRNRLMTYADFASAQSIFLWSTFAIALIMGAVVNKTYFCTMGAVSDWVNMSDTGRMRAWILAIAIGVLGVTALEAAGLVNVTGTFPPYL